MLARTVAAVMRPLPLLRAHAHQAALSRLRTMASAATHAHDRYTLNTPFISDTIPLAEGTLGHVEEIMAEVGQQVEENEVVAVVETDKVSLDIRASRGGVIHEVLVEVGEEVKEQQAIFTLEELVQA